MTPALRLPVTVVILAFNEEIHLGRCLSRLGPLVTRIVVVDSYSSDRTVAIAGEHGADVLQRVWTNHAEQFRWGVAAANIDTPWVMRIDCDEYFEPGALEALGVQLATLPLDVTGVTLRRKFIFRDRWIRHGCYYPVVLLRLWRAGAADIEQRWMDEHIVLTRGRAVPAACGDLVDHNLNDIDHWTTKHNRYATLAMLDAINREHAFFTEDDRIQETGGAARRNRFLKTAIYGRAPLYWRALALYLYRYVLRLGFLDGREGLLFHFLHGFWLFMLIDAKIDEARTLIRTQGLDAFRRSIRDRHGIDL